MVTRSIVGRFLILAVLLVSLGVIAQAALIISRGPKSMAKAATGPDKATLAAQPAPAQSASSQSASAQPSSAPSSSAPSSSAPSSSAASSSASLDSSAANAATPGAAAQGADAAPVRVVYPGPLGTAPVQPQRKITDAAPAVPSAAPVQTVAAVTPAPPPPATDVPPAPVVAPQAVAAPAATPAVVVASADADAPPAPSGHGINLNSASIEELNRLGGGHIGHSIVQHRPYHSVEDLVKKRVVRRSVYEQIKSQVAAD